MGFMVWGHHMFVSGMNPYAGFAFSTLTTAIAVPSAIKVFNWWGTIYGGKIRFSTPFLFSAGFVSLFITGGLTGPLLAQPSLDIYLHDTYVGVAHFHLIMAMAGLFAVFAATHFWITFLGEYAIFMPMHLLGAAGHPRRYSELTGVQYVSAMEPLQRFITIAAVVTIAGQVIFLVNLFWSMFKGRKASANPWECSTLEWTLPSPVPAQGFGQATPVVNHGPYEYSVSGMETDFLPQDASATEGS